MILWNDWPALASWISVLMTWTLYCVALYIKGAQQIAYVFPPAIVVTIIYLALVVWRIGRVYALFTNDVEVQGEVTNLWIVRDRGRLEFRYPVEGAEFDCWVPVHKTAHVLGFSAGQSVGVLVHPTNPRHAIVGDLYVPALVAPAARTRQ